MEKDKNMASAYEKTVDIIDHSKDMPAEEAIDALIRCIKTGYNLAVEKAIHALADIDHPSVVPALIRLYDWFQADSRKRDRSCDARTAIVEALGCIGSTQSISLLKKAARTVERAKLGPRIEDAAISLRAAAAIALAKVDPDCLYELAVLLFDEKPDVPVSTANRPYKKPARHIRGLRAHGRNPRPQRAAAEEISLGAFVRPFGKRQADADYRQHVNHHNNHNLYVISHTLRPPMR